MKFDKILLSIHDDLHYLFFRCIIKNFNVYNSSNGFFRFDVTVLVSCKNSSPISAVTCWIVFISCTSSLLISPHCLTNFHFFFSWPVYISFFFLFFLSVAFQTLTAFLCQYYDVTIFFPPYLYLTLSLIVY